MGSIMKPLINEKSTATYQGVNKSAELVAATDFVSLGF